MPTAAPATPLRLTNQVRRYDWGSHDAIPSLMGVSPDGSPWAELWLGAHGSAPSTVSVEGVEVDLATLIQRDPIGTLGRRVAEDFGPRLPYLLKILAAGRALSLQVHPKPHLAREGFNLENAAGVPLGSPRRTFHDDQHKPEMVIALSRFDGLAGFRSPAAILALLDGIDGDLVASVRRLLAANRSTASIRKAFRLLLSARDNPDTCDDITATVRSVAAAMGTNSRHTLAYETVIDLSRQHPGDPGALASMMLNRVRLESGEGLFIPSGEVHAYLSGLAIEVMASSDNVLRAGLTTKLVDESALIRCASFVPRAPARPTVTVGADGSSTSYRAPVEEFAITTCSIEAGQEARLPVSGPRIVLAHAGAVTLHTQAASINLVKGDSVFLPHSAGSVTVTGTGQAVCAWVP